METKAILTRALRNESVEKVGESESHKEKSKVERFLAAKQLKADRILRLACSYIMEGRRKGLKRYYFKGAELNGKVVVVGRPHRGFSFGRQILPATTRPPS